MQRGMERKWEMGEYICRSVHAPQRQPMRTQTPSSAASLLGQSRQGNQPMGCEDSVGTLQRVCVCECSRPDCMS